MSENKDKIDSAFFADFYEKVHNVGSAHELFFLISNVASTYGFSHYSIIYVPEAVETQFQPHFLSTDWPAGLLEAFDKNDLLSQSPFIEKLRTSLTPVSFDLDHEGSDLSTDQRTPALQIFREYKILRGTYFPCFDSRGRKGAISFDGERALPTNEETPVLHMLSSYAFKRLHTLLKSDITAEELTKRERECLTLAARGKTTIESSNSLGISENTVAGYLASTSRKLSARNKAHMIAIAYENGLLHRHENE